MPVHMAKVVRRKCIYLSRVLDAKRRAFKSSGGESSARNCRHRFDKLHTHKHTHAHTYYTLAHVREQNTLFCLRVYARSPHTITFNQIPLALSLSVSPSISALMCDFAERISQIRSTIFNQLKCLYQSLCGTIWFVFFSLSLFHAGKHSHTCLSTVFTWDCECVCVCMCVSDSNSNPRFKLLWPGIEIVW